MKDINNNAGLGLDESVDQNVKIQLVEYALAGMSVVGTIVVGVTNQAVFAVAPLTLSMILNLFSRRQLDQLTRQHTFADTTELQRKLKSEVQSLRTQVTNLPAFQERSDYNDVKVTVTSLSASVATLEQQMMNSNASVGQPLEAISAMETEINQLREYQIDLTHSLESLQGQSPNGNGSAPPSEEIHQQLSTLQTAVAKLSKQSKTGGTEITDLGPLRSEFQAMLAPVQQQLVSLSEQLEHRPSSAGEGTDSQNEQSPQVHGQIEDLKIKMDIMLANISEEMEIARGAMEDTQNQVNVVQHQLGVVRQESMSSTDTDTSNPEALHQQVQAAIGPLQEQISQLEGQLKGLSVESNGNNGNGEPSGESRRDLEDLSSRLDQISAQLSSEMANLPNLVDEQVQNRVSDIRSQAIPPIDESAKQTSVSELDSLLADLS